MSMWWLLLIIPVSVLLTMFGMYCLFAYLFLIRFLR